MSGSWTLRHKRITAVLLVVLMTITAAFCMGGCTAGSDNAGSSGGAAPGTIVSETDSELTVVDQAGREVTVSKDIQSIALCYSVVIRFLLNLGQGDKITGIGKSEPFLEELQPSLKECADVGKGVADIEALAALEPDLFIHKASDVETLEAVSKIGIPSVGIEVETPEDMLVAVKLLGIVCGVESKADELAAYYEKAVGGLGELAASIPDQDKKTAIVMGSSIGKVADGSMLQGRMLETAGAINSASDLKATELWPTAGTEQIFSWDPDYIFITGGASYTAEDIYSDDSWSELKAVRDRHVYVMPAKEDSWEFPGIVSVLGIEYMMNTMYKDLLPDDKLDSDVQEFYEMAYGRTYSRSQLGY